MSEEDFEKSKGAYTPGWNDPPLFSYENHQIQPKGYSLNKRVAYNLADDTGQQEKSNTKDISQGPPIGPPPVSCLPSKPQVNETQNTTLCKPIELSVILGNLHTILKEMYTEENEKEYKEIQRRLSVMEKMWNEQKFSENVKQKLYDISEALRESNIEVCDTLQRSLMVDHTSICSSWMPAIRLLINSKRS